MTPTDVRPPVTVFADEGQLAAFCPSPGWTAREGFELPERPWDLTGRRWVCTGVVASEVDARAALAALVRGVGLAVVVRGPGRFRLRVLDDLHRNGAVTRSAAPDPERVPLHPDEEALLRALAGGATVAEAARQAAVSLRTAQRRLASIRSTYGASNTTEAVARWLADQRRT